MTASGMALEQTELEKRCFWSIARRGTGGFPDIQIKVGNYCWNVHSNLLLQESAHFRQVLEGKDEDSVELMGKTLLVSEKPQNVVRMLVWLYGGSNFLGPCTSVVHNIDPTFTFHDFMNLARINTLQPADHACATGPSIIEMIDLLLICGKYSMTNFATACLAQIERALQTCSPVDFANTATHSRTLGDGVCVALSRVLAKVTAERFHALSTSDFRNYLADYPDFTWDVMKIMNSRHRELEAMKAAAQVEDLKMMQQNAAKGGKKRKAGE